jgi:hypothetical protein
MAVLTPPATLADAAAVLRREAARLDDTAQELRREVGGIEWDGRVARDFDRHHTYRQRYLSEAVARLTTAATLAERAAEHARTELVELRRLEDEVRDRMVLDGATPPGDLPPSGDTRWREVHQAVVGGDR